MECKRRLKSSNDAGEHMCVQQDGEAWPKDRHEEPLARKVKPLKVPPRGEEVGEERLVVPKHHDPAPPHDEGERVHGVVALDGLARSRFALVVERLRAHLPAGEDDQQGCEGREGERDECIVEDHVQRRVARLGGQLHDRVRPRHPCDPSEGALHQYEKLAERRASAQPAIDLRERDGEALAVERGAQPPVEVREQRRWGESRGARDEGGRWLVLCSRGVGRG